MAEQCKIFLDAFCVDFPETLPTENGELPFVMVLQELAEPEFEGACLEWCYQFVISRNCPPLLAMKISRTVTDATLAAMHQQQAASNNVNCKEDGSLKEKPYSGLIASKILGWVFFRELLRVCHSWDCRSVSSPNWSLSRLVSVHAIKNSRRKMEDRHVILSDFNHLVGVDAPPSSYYAVFDGHGGVDAAQYASVYLHCALARHLRSGSTSVEALKQAFLDTDSMFVERAQRENLPSGSTAVCVLVGRSKLHIAWLGDSQALLVRNGQPIQLMTPHKPEREDEKKRIEALGGSVVFIGAWRVNGTLSVSRSIGDASHKPYVSGEPDVESVDYLPGDWLVLGCDGLWDELMFDDIAEIIADGEPSTIAQRLIKSARDKGSSDNITAMVVRLGDESEHGSVDNNQHADNASRKNMDNDGRRDADDRGSGGSRDADEKSSNARNSSVGTERINTSTESSRLALSMKRSAETELEDSEDENSAVAAAELLNTGDMELDGDFGAFREDSSNSTDMLKSSQDSQRNVFDLSKAGSFEDALVMATADICSELSRSSSGPSDALRTTSEDTSGHSPDTSGDVGSGENHASNVRRRCRHRSLHKLLKQKENQRPTGDDDFASETPPCLHHGSPVVFEDDPGRMQHSFHESCRSLSLVSSGPLLGALHAGGSQRASMTRSSTDSRVGRPASATNPSRWTIAVEVDADAGEFESSLPSGTEKILAMNLSSHW